MTRAQTRSSASSRLKGLLRRHPKMAEEEAPKAWSFADQNKDEQAVALAALVYVRVRRCVQWLNGCCPCIVRNCCCTSLLGIPNARPKGKRKTDVSGRTRDLDV